MFLKITLSRIFYSDQYDRDNVLIDYANEHDAFDERNAIPINLTSIESLLKIITRI